MLALASPPAKTEGPERIDDALQNGTEADKNVGDTADRNVCATRPGLLRFGGFLGWAITFVSVNIGWAFFCMDLPTSLLFFKRLFGG